MPALGGSSLAAHRDTPDIPRGHLERDTTLTPTFDGLLKNSNVEPIILPPQRPHLNAPCERFVRSIKEEAVAQMWC
jgi:transposase InsO family protein